MSEPALSAGTGRRRAADLSDRLRLEVGRFRAAERRRVFPTALYAGTPGGPRVHQATQDLADADGGLRRELATALLDRARQTIGGAAYAWTTRPGVPDVHDQDLLWFAASRWAAESLGDDLGGFFVLTKGGWLDVATGERRVWKRLRL